MPTSSPPLLVVEDDPVGGRLLLAMLATEGVAAHLESLGRGALDAASRRSFRAAIVDLRLPDMSGLDVLDGLRRAHPTLPVFMLSAHVEVGTAVEAMRRGARDYLTKPIDRVDLLRALELRESDVPDLGPSAAMRAVAARLARVAHTDVTVLLLGETGTGKDVVARALHAASRRSAGPFVPVDCGALPDHLMESEMFGHERGAFTGADRRHVGLLQQASGGTVFLDEIGNLPLGLQAKLLRALQERNVRPVGGRPSALDARFVAATNVDLATRVAEGGFRADLYWRLAEYVLELPPLRDRVEDVVWLADRFRREACVEFALPDGGMDDDARAALRAHAWPGNVRELRNVVRRALLGSDDGRLRANVLPRGVPGPTTLKEIGDAAAARAEAEAIARVLREVGGNKAEAARRLRTDYKTLSLKAKAYGLG